MHVIYQQFRFPVLQNRVYDSQFEAIHCPVGDISLVQDSQTGLIYNEKFNKNNVIYDENYQNEQAVSKQFQKHLKDVLKIIERNMTGLKLVEIGCGKGYFLELLLSKGFNIIGFDPAYQGTNPRIQRKYFPKVNKLNVQGIILRHILEHISDPLLFLNQLKNSCSQNSLIYIEVPCFNWICQHRAWYDIYYEHVNYFRISDFYRIFSTIIESGHIFGGQYLYIVAKLSSLNIVISGDYELVSFPKDFTQKIDSITLSSKQEMTIWGGGSRGVIFSLMMKRAGKIVKNIIDINSAKQGKYLPGSGIIVKSPAEILPNLQCGDPIYVMNSNYLSEIKLMSKNKFKYICIEE